jgi:hypothetical protein
LQSFQSTPDENFGFLIYPFAINCIFVNGFFTFLKLIIDIYIYIVFRRSQEEWDCDYWSIIEELERKGGNHTQCHLYQGVLLPWKGCKKAIKRLMLWFILMSMILPLQTIIFMCLVLGSFIPVSKVCLLHPFVFIGIKLHYDIMVVTLSLTIRDERQKLDLYFNTTLF